MDSEENGKLKDTAGSNTGTKTSETRTDEKTHTVKEDASTKDNSSESENRRSSSSIDDDDEGRRVKRRKEKDDHVRKDEHGVKKDDHNKNKNTFGNEGNPKLNAAGIATASTFMTTAATTITTAATSATTAAVSSATTSTTTTPAMSETAENEDTFNCMGSPGPKVPPLKIVIPPVESEQGNRNGKAVARHHGGLPYVVVSNDEPGATTSASPSSPNQNPPTKDEESVSSTASLSNEEQRIQQRVLRSTHSNRITANLGSGNNTSNNNNSNDSNTNNNHNEGGNHPNNSDNNSIFPNNTNTSNSRAKNNSSNTNPDNNVNSTSGGTNSASVGNAAGNSSSSGNSHQNATGDGDGVEHSNSVYSSDNSSDYSPTRMSITGDWSPLINSMCKSKGDGNSGAKGGTKIKPGNTTAMKVKTKPGSSKTKAESEDDKSASNTGEIRGATDASHQDNATGDGDGVEHRNTVYSSDSSDYSPTRMPMTGDWSPMINSISKSKGDGNSGAKGGTKIKPGNATAMKVKTKPGSSKIKAESEDDKSAGNGSEIRGATDASHQDNATGDGDSVEHRNTAYSSDSSSDYSPTRMPMTGDWSPMINSISKSKGDGNSGAKGGTKIKPGNATAMKVKTKPGSSKIKAESEDDKSAGNGSEIRGATDTSHQDNATGDGDGVEHRNTVYSSDTSSDYSPPRMMMVWTTTHESTNSGSANKDDGNNATAKSKPDGNSRAKGGTKIETGNTTAMKVKTEPGSSKTKPESEDDKSAGNGSEIRGAAAADNHSKDVATPVVELHPRKRKLKSKQEINHTTAETDHTIAFGSAPHPHEVPVTNCFQMFMDIRRQIDVKRKGLFPIQPKPPQGFKDYLMNRCTYTLAGNSIPRLKRRNAEPPEGIDERLKDLYQDQEAERYSLRMQHVVEKEKLVLSVEQEILRVHGRAARALANQALPFSACTILKDEEVYNVITPEQEEKDRNARSRYNGRLFISWLQDVDDKWEKIKEEMLARHHKEAESLNAVQKFNWDLKMRQLGLWKKQKLAPVDESHVPMISVSDDFDLLTE